MKLYLILPIISIPADARAIITPFCQSDKGISVSAIYYGVYDSSLM